MRVLNLIMLIAAMMLGIFATSAHAQVRDHMKVGKGDYFVFVFDESQLASVNPEVYNKRKTQRLIMPVTTRDIDAVSTIDAGMCRPQARAQMPSAIKTIGLVGVRNLPGAVAGGYLGSIAGGLVPKGSVVTAVGYGKYNGVATVGGSIGAGINAHEMGKHTTVAGCMAGLVPKAQQAGYVNKNIYIAYNTFPVNGHAIKRSQFADPTADASVSTDTRANDDSDSDSVAPPPAPGQ